MHCASEDHLRCRNVHGHARQRPLLRSQECYQDSAQCGSCQFAAPAADLIRFYTHLPGFMLMQDDIDRCLCSSARKL